MKIKLDPKELKPAKSLGVVPEKTQIEDKDDGSDKTQTLQPKPGKR